ncbi:LacI family transcriptional regulator [Cryobacterium melibiosiphilum]|uniref:LacI family transcriptional regulator n=1 Tax=Cryobacterium melibiosiphilum TaxID=995039 RepID=A0A3A5MIW1_9MICO|nr:LacI family DNA-binding transcriptional regulator [Cryobacterium melibiosiphilum]RJT89332.1 LacI family transcriptional regulator [Cryobacterium melibiosiphilum]
MVSVPARRKRATIHDVAVEAGVSRGTVSRVVNDEPYVSASARAAIEAAIEKVGYVPNNAARSLVMQRSQAVGFIVHEPHSLFLEDPNIGEILLGANTALSDADYQMVCLIIDSERDTARVARYLSGGFVDGVIIVSARQHDPITRVVEKLGLPTAFVGHPPDLRDLPFVGIDNRRSARDLTERLLATGRQRVGMIAAALDRDSGADRLAGFTDALGERFDPALVASVPLYAYAAGVEGMRELLHRSPDIDGVFAASDAVAAGALEALRDAGRSVPGDVGVVGFDDSAWARRTQPPLSTVHQPASGLGAGAAELVLQQLRGEATPVGGLLLHTPIVWRASA